MLLFSYINDNFNSNTPKGRSLQTREQEKENRRKIKKNQKKNSCYGWYGFSSETFNWLAKNHVSCVLFFFFVCCWYWLLKYVITTAKYIVYGYRAETIVVRHAYFLFSMLGSKKKQISSIFSWLEKWRDKLWRAFPQIECHKTMLMSCNRGVGNNNEEKVVVVRSIKFCQIGHNK